jgi:CheY-like chemotaxis protein
VSEPKKILVIDDDPDTVTFVTTLLQDHGYAVVSAADGRQGLETARKERPALICLDITMPEMSGVKFYREVRSDPALQQTPVLMLTGVTDEFQKFISTRKQVPPPDGYLSKPFVPDDLVRLVQKLLGS